MRWFESSRPSVMRRTLDAVLDAFERGDLDDALPWFSQTCVYREPRGESIVGRDALAAHWAAFAASGVRWRFSVDRVIAGDDAVCIVHRFAMPEGDGTAWRERAGCAVVRFDARGFIEEWREYDG